MNSNESLTAQVDWPEPGKYVVAVSGGADSMVLLDLLIRSDVKYSLIVAHYDHAMRAESSADEALVGSIAKTYGLGYRTERSEQPLRSEAEARAARYDFLERVRAAAGAQAIVTAHHLDDVIETSLLNLARGTGRRGLAPMRSGRILRPLLGIGRRELRAYAAARDLRWQEDASNYDESNPRNFLRHSLLPIAAPQWRTEYMDTVNDLSAVNDRIDAILETYIVREQGSVRIDRLLAQALAVDELRELVVYAARVADPSVEFNERLVTELAQFVRSGKTGRHRPVNETLNLDLERAYLRFMIRQIGSNEGK